MLRCRPIPCLALANYLVLCTGLGLSLHIGAEGPEHAFEPDDCPVCHQLTLGAVAEADGTPTCTLTWDTDPGIAMFWQVVPAVLPSRTLDRAGPRAPPCCPFVAALSLRVTS